MVILNSTAQLIEDQTVAVLGPHLNPSRLSWLIETSGTFIITPTGSPYSYQIYFSFARGTYRLDCVEIRSDRVRSFYYSKEVLDQLYIQYTRRTA